MRIFITDEFEDFMKVGGLTDRDIIKSVNEVNSGLIDADLGGVIKKRIAPKGIGKRDASRSIIALVKMIKYFLLMVGEKRMCQKRERKYLINYWKHTVLSVEV